MRERTRGKNRHNNPRILDHFTPLRAGIAGVDQTSLWVHNHDSTILEVCLAFAVVRMMEYEYKVIDVADGAISSLLLGEGRIETGVLEAYINAMASEGWRLVFMEKVMQRQLVVSNRETLMVTFERAVPESEREARAARCIDDVISAEDAAKRQGYKAAAGAVGLAAGTAAIGALVGGLLSDE